MAFARTEEYEALFARGYPHLRRLVSPHPDEADAAAWAQKVLDSSDSVHYHVDWPREVAYRFVRALPKVGEMGIGFSRHADQLTKAGFAALATPGPVDEDEGRALLAALVDPSLNAYQFAIEHALFLLEAMIGSAAAADAILGKLEAMPQLDGKFSTTNYIAYDLGFILRRLAPAERAAAEARIRAIVASKPESYTRDFLTYIIGGRAALAATPKRKLGLWNTHFADDPELVLKLAHESCAYFDAHHAYLAGDRIFDALAKGWRKLAGPRKPWVVDELAHIASPKVEPILATLGQTKALAPRVAGVLAARGSKVTVAAKPPAATKPKPTLKTKMKANVARPSSARPKARATSSGKPKPSAKSTAKARTRGRRA